jgi:membrane associated rhomboid family serine protease
MGPVDPTPTMPPPPTRERCYRHPDVETGVHCTRCGRPICPDCMIPAPVGHQCPECVAEARREYRRGPGRQIARANLRATTVTKILLIAIAVGFVWELVAGGMGSFGLRPSGQALLDAGAAFPPAIATGQWWRLLTSIFLHADLLHLGTNAFVLWIFGTQLEREIGRPSFLAVFLATGLFASATSYAFSDPRTLAVGASGAVFGIVGAFVTYHYLRRHHVLAEARLRSAVGMVLLNLVIGFLIPQIDWRAHVGGLVAGVIAGFAVDPSRPDGRRRAAAIAGLTLVITGAVVLVVIRTAQLRDAFF